VAENRKAHLGFLPQKKYFTFTESKFVLFELNGAINCKTLSISIKSVMMNLKTTLPAKMDSRKKKQM
jgi:hypothetical protein